MVKPLYCVMSLVAIATLNLTLVPQSDAQITDLEFQKGRARTACRRQAEQEGLRVNSITVTIPVTDSLGQMTGSEVIMNVSRSGSSYDVRCNFDNAFETATISNLPNSGEGSETSTSSTQGTFQGRGLARGSVFGNEQTTDAQLDLNGSNFSFSLLSPGGTGGTQVNYIGTVRSTRQAGSSRSNSGFILQGRVRSFASSTDGLQIINVTGNCEIEVFDARVIFSSCNTRLEDSGTRFDGLQQF